jgi:hypothetical protein
VTHPHPVNKNTVKATLRKTGTWSGWLTQSNVNSFHVTSGWCLGFPVTVTSVEELDKVCTEFHWYNDDAELGHRVRLWQTD